MISGKKFFWGALGDGIGLTAETQRTQRRRGCRLHRTAGKRDCLTRRHELEKKAIRKGLILGVRQRTQRGRRCGPDRAGERNCFTRRHEVQKKAVRKGLIPSVRERARRIGSGIERSARTARSPSFRRVLETQVDALDAIDPHGEALRAALRKRAPRRMAEEAHFRTGVSPGAFSGFGGAVALEYRWAHRR